MHNTYIYGALQNRGYAPGLTLGRRGVSWISQWRLQDLVLYENLLLVLLDDLLKLMITGGHDLHQLVLYMHAMVMQHLVFMQQYF